MKNFLERLLNREDPTSSRRLSAMIGLGTFVTSVICSLSGVTLPPEVLYVTAGFTLSCLGLTTLKK